MAEYIGRAARISGDLSGEVRIHGVRMESRIDDVEDGLITFKTTAVVDAADLLDWLKAQGLVVVPVEVLQEYVDAKAEEDAIQQEAQRTGRISYSGRLGRAMFELGRAITDATTTKEGESGGD